MYSFRAEVLTACNKSYFAIKAEHTIEVLDLRHRASVMLTDKGKEVESYRYENGMYLLRFVKVKLTVALAAAHLEFPAGGELSRV